MSKFLSSNGITISNNIHISSGSTYIMSSTGAILAIAQPESYDTKIRAGIVTVQANPTVRTAYSEYHTVATLYFPVFNKYCEYCDSRYKCLTANKIEQELTSRHYDLTTCTLGAPFRFGLGCFKVDPTIDIYDLSLRLMYDEERVEYGMELVFNYE